MTNAGATERLAAFAAGSERFAPEVVEQGKRMLLDQFACQIAGAPLPWSRAYRDAIVGLGGTGAASLVYYGDRLAPDEAAFVNSTFGHANEFDDTHLGAAMHPSAIVVPPVFALGEVHRRSGRDVLAAVIVGTEIAIRIAAAAAPHLHERGHHVPTSAGPFGAAAACSRLLGLDADACLNAMAIAGSHAGGVMEYSRSGGSVKRMHCAIPAAAGLRSAVLAAHGITGPGKILEGDRGFFVVFAGACDEELLTGDLGERYQLLGTSFKPFAANLSTHAALEALATMRDEQGLRAADVAAITIGTSSSAVRDIGRIIEPTDILGAQTSFAFGAAVALLRGGNGPDDYHEDDLRDPQFLALARRVEMEVDPICDDERKRLRNRSAVVTVRTTDGRTLQERVQFPKGSPECPLTTADVRAKFTNAVEPHLGRMRTEQLAETIWNIERLDDVADFLPLCAAQPATVSTGVSGRNPHSAHEPS
jgi:2-methylcitrate dehydratase PrpD